MPSRSNSVVSRVAYCSQNALKPSVLPISYVLAERDKNADATQFICSNIRSDDTIAFDLISQAGVFVKTLRAYQGVSAFNLDPRHEAKRQVDLNLAAGAVCCLEHHFNMSNVSLVNNTRVFQAS